MKIIVIVSFILTTASCFAETYTPSGDAKVFKGDEGEMMTFIPLNHNTLALLYPEHTLGRANRHAVIFSLYGVNKSYTSVGFPAEGASTPEQPDRGAHRVFFSRAKPGLWNYFDIMEGYESVMEVQFHYSEELSRKAPVVHLLKIAKPYSDFTDWQWQDPKARAKPSVNASPVETSSSGKN